MSDHFAEKTYALFETEANRKLITDLESAGAKTLLFPTVKTESIQPDKSTIELLKNLALFDWLIFPDVFTVDYFLETLAANAVDFYELDAIQSCAFGEAVADRLRFNALHADVIPAMVGAQAVYNALADFIGESALAGLKILFPKQMADKNVLPAKLRDKGAAVVELPIYKIEAQSGREIARLKTLLKGGAIDRFIFTAPTDFISLENYFTGETLADVFAETEASASDGATFQAAREREIRRAVLFRSDNVGKVEL